MVYTPKFKKGDRIKNIRDHRIDQVTDVVYKEDTRYPFHKGYGYILYPRGGGWWLCEEIDIEFEIVPEKTEEIKQQETEDTEDPKKTEQSNRARGKSRRNTKRRRKTRGNKRRKTRGNKRRKTFNKSYKR